MKFKYFIPAQNDFHIERNPAKRYSARSTTEATLKFDPGQPKRRTTAFRAVRDGEDTKEQRVIGGRWIEATAHCSKRVLPGWNGKDFDLLRF
jgi:hypothetical protein